MNVSRMDWLSTNAGITITVWSQAIGGGFSPIRQYASNSKTKIDHAANQGEVSPLLQQFEKHILYFSYVSLLTSDIIVGLQKGSKWLNDTF